MREVHLYINDQRIDLFNDEQIEVTSSVQNIADIAKVYTDFSQTFTVPASKRNNALFQHYYNNDVDSTFYAKNRQEARIEINGIPFRRGQIQLEGSETRDNQAYSYRLTFYGDVVTLKDLFGDKKLIDLDYGSINHERTGANIQTSITTASNVDVRYPLISSSRVWSYNDATSTDISLVGNAIDYNELFPALKVAKIFELIESTFGVTFNGNFLTNKRFTRLFTWWKNKDVASFNSEPFPLVFNLGDTACNAAFVNDEGIGVSVVNVKHIDMVNYTQPVDWVSWYGAQLHLIKIHIYNTTTAATWYIDVIKNGVVNNTITGTGNVLNTVVTAINTPSMDDVYTFQVRSSGALTFDFDIKYEFSSPYFENVGGVYTGYVNSCTFTTTTNVITNYVDWNTTAPDILVSEYFAGVLRMFNLTCYPLDTEFNFQIEPLDDWYANGEDIDITKYVDVDTIEIDRPKLYKEIAFNWKESKNFLNTAYAEINGKPFGSLREFFGYDGGDFKIDLPFESFAFNKFTSTELQVAYSLETAPDYKPFTPAPVMLYLYEQAQICDFYFDNGTTTPNITSYYPFGQDCYQNFDEFTLNFNEEISSLTEDSEANSLYKTYYQTYLVNLFNNKTRIVTVKGHLPLRLLNYISLQDALIIRDKKYRINEMKNNLTTGEVRLVLISDWNVIRPKMQLPSMIVVPETGGDIDIPIKPVKPDKGGTVVMTDTGTFTSPSAFGTLTTEQTITFTVDTNTTGEERTDGYTMKYYLPNGTLTESYVFTIIQAGSTSELLTEDGGKLLTEDLNYFLI